MVSCNVTAQALEAGVHSGQGGGVAPETFSMLRVLLDRLDDAKTGQMKHFHAKVPPQKVGVGVGVGLVFSKRATQVQANQSCCYIASLCRRLRRQRLWPRSLVGRC